jgi:GT2 family glycosyltransferase
MPLSVDVVIPVHGQWELTERCLATLAARDACVRRIIVVDDKSPDDSAERLRGRTDIVPLILERNLGFSGASNAGARAGDADAIFFLNNDTLVPPGTIDRLAATLEESGASAVGPKICYGDGSLQVAAMAMLNGRTHFERLYAYLDADLPQAQIAYEPIALSGAAVLVRRADFEAVGGFEEAFKNGSEDVDLCLKLWAAGRRCRYEPRAQIVHLEGASRGKAIDTTDNDRLLEQRWEGRCEGVPRLTESRPPLLNLHWRSRTPLEAAVRRCFRTMLVAHAGAPVIDGAPVLAGLVALADRRVRLSIEHRGSGAPADIMWGAPVTAADAAAMCARGARRYWVPSQRSAALLRAAGVAANAVAVTRPGFDWRRDDPPRALTSAIVVHRETTADGQVGPLLTALGALPAERLIAERADDAAIARLRAAPMVIFADDGDDWGLLGTAALAGGALVVAPAGSTFLEIMPPEASVVADDAAAAAGAVRAIVAEPAAFAEHGPRAAREMGRRSPALYAGRRLRELGREQVHGAVDPLTLAIGPGNHPRATGKSSGPPGEANDHE